MQLPSRRRYCKPPIGGELHANSEDVQIILELSLSNLGDSFLGGGFDCDDHSRRQAVLCYLRLLTLRAPGHRRRARTLRKTSAFTLELLRAMDQEQQHRRPLCPECPEPPAPDAVARSALRRAAVCLLGALANCAATEPASPDHALHFLHGLVNAPMDELRLCMEDLGLHSAEDVTQLALKLLDESLQLFALNGQDEDRHSALTLCAKFTGNHMALATDLASWFMKLPEQQRQEYFDRATGRPHCRSEGEPGQTPSWLHYPANLDVLEVLGAALFRSTDGNALHVAAACFEILKNQMATPRVEYPGELPTAALLSLKLGMCLLPSPSQSERLRGLALCAEYMSAMKRELSAVPSPSVRRAQLENLAWSQRRWPRCIWITGIPLKRSRCGN